MPAWEDREGELWIEYSSFNDLQIGLLAEGVEREMLKSLVAKEWKVSKSKMGGLKQVKVSGDWLKRVEEGTDGADLGGMERSGEKGETLEGGSLKIGMGGVIPALQELGRRIESSDTSTVGDVTRGRQSAIQLPTPRSSRRPSLEPTSAPSPFTDIPRSVSPPKDVPPHISAIEARYEARKQRLASEPPTPLDSRPPSPSPILSSLPVPPYSVKPDPVPAFVSELVRLQSVFELAAKQGGAAFLALDIETYEFSHNQLLEFGWSLLDFGQVVGEGEKVEVRRENQHVIISENARRRNGKYSPDARDVRARSLSPPSSSSLTKGMRRQHFDFGRSITLPQQSLFILLHALFSTLSSSTPLFLTFHDTRSDLKSLALLGFQTQEFETGLHRVALQGGEGVWVVDTQRLFSGWRGMKGQVKLMTCCEAVEVPTRRLHNAGSVTTEVLQCCS